MNIEIKFATGRFEDVQREAINAFVADLERGGVACELTFDGTMTLGTFTLSKSHKYLWRLTPWRGASDIIEIIAWWHQDMPALVLKRPGFLADFNTKSVHIPAPEYLLKRATP